MASKPKSISYGPFWTVLDGFVDTALDLDFFQVDFENLFLTNQRPNMQKSLPNNGLPWITNEPQRNAWDGLFKWDLGFFNKYLSKKRNQENVGVEQQRHKGCKTLKKKKAARCDLFKKNK